MNFINNFLLSSSFNKISPFISRKLFKIFKIFFVETDLKNLPINNYEVEERLEIELNVASKNNRDDKPHISYPDLLNLLMKLKKENQEFKFCDYGAGNLNLFYYLNLNLKNLYYYFYDQEYNANVVSRYKTKYKISNLYIHKKETDEIFDFVYFGSSLQYIKNYKEIIKKFINSKYILFAQTPFYSEPKSVESVILKQINMHPKINYLYMFNLGIFVEFMLNNKYKLVNKNLNRVTKFMNFKNFKPVYKNLNMYDLLFEKIIK